MAEESFEALFGSCVLEVITPDTSISFPGDVVADDWLSSVKQPHAERKQAFFGEVHCMFIVPPTESHVYLDEQLSLLLLMHVKHPSLNNPHDHYNPPRPLVEFLSHVQVSLEATYISKTPSQDVSSTSALIPPRTSSTLKSGSSLHPSIFPPHTPNPIPSTAESDRKYVQSEGTLLFSGIWGAKRTTEDLREKFTLLFSEVQTSWIAVYEVSLIVCK